MPLTVAFHIGRCALLGPRLIYGAVRDHHGRPGRRVGGMQREGEAMGLLDGRSAVITGGGSGIGAATCRRMSEEGAAVSVLDLDGDAAERVAKEIDGHAYQVDVT